MKPSRFGGGRNKNSKTSTSKTSSSSKTTSNKTLAKPSGDKKEAKTNSITGSISGEGYEDSLIHSISGEGSNRDLVDDYFDDFEELKMNAIRANDEIDESVYDAIINQVSDNPKNPPVCAFCEDENHFFDKCPIITNEEFLREFTIKCYTLLRRIIRAEQKKHREAKVNFISADEIDDAFNDDDLLDFRQGGV